ncbi:Gfo/Idh/MocA family oxidoreductase [Jiangella mangrovi]|uniref:Putative dehydrogenase n=1 Tax=Jiangella mangrovi TaxID=1524084 RepID=A0A7W9GX66_9ACTN|nr:putative dehydrogenase [Jiangella mangrovi]
MADRLRVAVVGLNFGRWLVENELLTGPGSQACELVGVCDLDVAKARALAGSWSVAAYADYDEVLADPGVDAVVLMVGPVGKGALVSRVVAAGKPVMTTKPFETSSALALSALREAAAAEVPVFLNSPTAVPEPDMRTLLDWIGRHDLGRPVAYRASTWCAYRERPDGSWYDDPALCPAAPITRLGVYLLNDLARFVAPVRDVAVQQSRLFTGRPTSDNAQLALVHDDGTLGTVFASFCVGDGQPYLRSMELNFERGTLYRNVGMAPGDDRRLVRLGVSAVVDGVRVVDAAEVEQSDTGYQWELFRRACRGEDVGPLIAPEQVASAIGVLERLT